MTVVVIVLLVIAVVLWVVRSLRGPGPRPPRPGTWDGPEVASGVVTLDLTVDDADAPAVRRLVSDAARRALRADPDLEEVEVRNRDGVVLGRLSRPAPLPPPPSIPDDLREPHVTRDRTPRPVRASGASTTALPEPDTEIDLTVPGVPLADRFDLPDPVRRRVRDPERALDVVRAILEASGRPVRVERDLAVSGDTAIAVVPPSITVGDDLSQAFMRIQAAGAARGVVIRLGYVDPEVIRHREAAAPHVRHVTAEAIQRMADAVEAGGDPVEFAVGPAVLR